MKLGGSKLLLSVVALLAVMPAGAAPLTLEAALEKALVRHPDAEMARARVMEAEARYAEARSGNLPRLDGRISYMQTTNPVQAFGTILNQGTFDNTIDFNDPGQLDSLTAGLETRYRVYSGGGRTAHIKSAESMRMAGEQSLSATESGLEDAVVAAYFGIRQADDIVRSIEAGIRVLEENLRISKIREESGELIRTERLNLEVELATLQRELLGSQHQATLARLQMAFLLGEPAGAGIVLAEADPSVERIAPPPTLSIENRPELQAARAAAEATTHGIRAAKAGYQPTVDAYASWQSDKGWRREGDGSSWTAGLVMNVPIFDGSATRARVSAARAQERAAMEAVRRMELVLNIELEQARLGHELAIAQKGVAEKQLLQAEEAAQLSRERFAAGTLLSTELIGVESRLTDARVQLALATSQERSALAHLRRVAGYPVLN
ncbi:MAG TPA: TolC family protein [Oceanipulchritudo sp.]|nr:TolC family protein [Oceanipulchritudo sp.]